MVDDTKKIGDFTGAAAASAQTSQTKKTDQLGKDEFLKLLVTQLKNQDPEAPMDSKEFAVQLAQFTQVEQLVSINNKLGGGAGDISSVSGYLGHYVTLSGDGITVAGGNGGSLSMNLAQNAADVKVDILNKDGEVIGSSNLGPAQAGKRSVQLKDLNVPDGSYSVKVTAVSSSTGQAFNPEVATGGMVTGVIPGPTPKLMVDGREVTLDQVKEVTVAPDSSN